MDSRYTATVSKFTCEKGEQMFRVDLNSWVDKLYISNIPYGKLYFDDVEIQDINGDTCVNIGDIAQFIYKKVRFDRNRRYSNDILGLNQLHAKIMKINSVTLNTILTTSRYDRRFNSINCSKCNIYIKTDTSDDIVLQYNHFNDIYCSDVVETPGVKYSVYNEPLGALKQSYIRVVETTVYNSKDSDDLRVKTKSHQCDKICCLIL
jgi:hypothetical protein